MKNSSLPLLYSMLILCFSCTEKSAKESSWEGKVEREQLSLVTKVPGRVAEIRVQEGQQVQAGDTLLLLEIPEVSAKEDQARGAIESASAQYNMAKKGATEGQLKQLNAKVSALKEQLDFAEKSVNRLNNLLQDSLVAQQKYDEVYAKYQGAKSQYIAAVAELEEVRNGARVEQQEMALGQKERALGALTEVQVAGKERFIIAPQAMTVERINLKIGELALAGYTIISGTIDESIYFRFTLPEDKLKDFQQGSTVKLIIPSKNKLALQGTITSISALTSYASITTAYPDFDQQQALFELKIKPLAGVSTVNLLTKSTVLLKNEANSSSTTK